MVNNRLWRSLSAFNHSTRRWAVQCQVTSQSLPLSPTPFSPRNIDTSTTLSLLSWNIDAFSPRPIERSKRILNHILEAREVPNIVFLQEVTLGVRDTLLNDPRVRNAFLVTDAEDRTSFKDVPFTTMTLLSNRHFATGVDLQNSADGKVKGRARVGRELILGRVSRVALPSKYRRDALSIDVAHPTAPGTVLRLINVHLDSLGDTLHYRAQQIGILAGILREPGCSGGIIAGDFNAISIEDHALIDKNELVDAWVALRGTADADGATWGVGVERRNGRAPSRLDKVATIGAKARKIEVIRPGCIEVPRPAEETLMIPWSDHCGLRSQMCNTYAGAIFIFACDVDLSFSF